MNSYYRLPLILINTCYFATAFKRKTPGRMPLFDQRYAKAQYTITLGGLLFLGVITFLNTAPPLFDEILFVRNMPLFREHGLSEKFLLEMYDQAPGPLYQIIHSFFEPITHFEVPGIRLVNVFFFAVVIFLMFLILKRYFKGFEFQSELLLALNLVAVPVIWQIAGMALTEMPAVFFAVLSLLILGILVQRAAEVSVTTIGLSLLGGVCLGMAILGRTPFLMMIPAVAVLAFNPLAERMQRQTLSPVVIGIFIVSAVAICAPVFYIWKGLVPPHQAVISEGGLKIWHGVLAFAYAGIIVVLLVPQWFRLNKRIVLGLLALWVFYGVLNLVWWQVGYMPSYYLLASFLPAAFMKVYPYLVSPLLMVFSTYFIVHLAWYVFLHRNNAYYLMIAVTLVFVLTTCINIKHLFSSRYVAQAAPFLVLLIAEKDTLDWLKPVRLLIGIGIGYASLETYVSV
jgi:4-amino-4-deoxy-L-arabinose transferase-like glycosyltransferase